MPKKPKCKSVCDNISNFSVFNSPTVAITLLKHEDIEDGVVYNVCIDYILAEDPLQVISTTTDLYSNNPEELIVEAAVLSSIYSNIYDSVRVIDLDDTITAEEKTYSLDEIMAKLEV